MAFLTGCRGWRLVRSDDEMIMKDSTIVRMMYREWYDTTYVTITKEIQQVLADTSSVLENDYCISNAKITSDGFLFHSLETKPKQLPVPVKKTEAVRDSIVYIKYPYPVPVPVEVEKELTWWQLVRLHGFWYMLAALVLAIVWICRKPLVKLFIRVLKK